MSEHERQPDRDGGIFRPEAVAHHRAGGREHGDVLRLSPAWLIWSYRLVVGFFATMVLLLFLVRVHEYAEGPAVVRSGSTLDVVSDVAGVVQAVPVHPGDVVAAGAVLVQLDDVRQRAEVARYEQELADALAAVLRRPTDTAARARVRTVRAGLADARRRLALRRLTAPADGTVQDLRCRPGQAVQPGETVVTLKKQTGEFTLVIALPGRFRPQLAPGMPARLEVDGYPRAYQPVVLTHVAAGVVGPTEARRYLGRAIGDAVALAGPVVLVEAAPAAPTFTVDGVELPYADGLAGRVQVRLRSVPAILALIPGLRGIQKGRDHGFRP